MKHFPKQKNKGFTIIETLVAIFVLLIVTTGPLAFVQQGLQASFLARDQITAFFLAQESIEIMKNIRDNATLTWRSGGNVSDWSAGFGDCRPGNNKGNTVKCNIGLSSNSNIATSSCPPNNNKCPSLDFNTNTNTFTLPDNNSNNNSKYTRTIYVTRVESEELRVIIEVSWESAFSAPKRIVVQENIFKNF